jgi:hypothetical protein
LPMFCCSSYYRIRETIKISFTLIVIDRLRFFAKLVDVIE